MARGKQKDDQLREVLDRNHRLCVRVSELEDDAEAKDAKIAEREAAASAEIQRLAAELVDARKIINAFYTDVPIEGRRHYPYALTTRVNEFIVRFLQEKIK